MAKLTTRPDSTAFGLRMTERMTALGLDDQDVSDATGLNYSTVRKVRRRSKNPSMDTAAKIAKTLGVSTDWLLSPTEVGTSDNEGGACNGGSTEPAPVRSIQRLKRELAEAYASMSGEPIERIQVTVTIN